MAPAGTLRQLLEAPASEPVDELDHRPAVTRHTVAAGSGAVAVAALCALVAGYLVLGVGAHHTVTGSVHLTASGADALGSTCTSGSSSLSEGSDVVITDGGGTVLGSTHLGEGTFDGTSCVLPFTLRDVADADDYFITFDGGDEVSFDHEELAEDGWRVDVA